MPPPWLFSPVPGGGKPAAAGGQLFTGTVSGTRNAFITPVAGTETAVSAPVNVCGDA
jgi:hypothetical protein